MNLKFIVLIGIFLLSCMFIKPEKINKDQILVLEKEMIGTFKGIRFYFNRFQENQAFSIVQKKCVLDSDVIIHCTESYTLKDQHIKDEYCFFYEYKTSTFVLVEYSKDCKKNKNWLQNLFGKEKLRDGGFMIHGQDKDPLNPKKEYGIKLYFTKGNHRIFYQDKKYYFLFFFIGQEITFWEKLE